ncbi:MAG: response regulator [Candidatus Marinimicrobia bacterium]|nr:response regulator [Candidatus Neomarinimicrobiota bacterium]
MSLNILIVDDSQIVRRVIRKTLDIAEIPYTELYEAANGKEALDLLNENWVDLVFTDINMPIMGGIEMVKKLSVDDVLKDIPIIVVSTEGSTSRIDQLKKDGVSAYLRKPVTPEQLRDIVNDLIGGGEDE